MPDFSSGAQKLLPYWGAIQSAVAQRATTADLWDALRTAVAAEGGSIKGATAIDVSTLRGIAASQRRAGEAFGRAGAGDVITADMIGRGVQSRGLADQNLSPAWSVSYLNTINVDGEDRLVWRTSLFEGTLPTTVGEMIDSLNQDAQDLADSRQSPPGDGAGFSHVAVVAVQITAV